LQARSDSAVPIILQGLIKESAESVRFPFAPCLQANRGKEKALSIKSLFIAIFKLDIINYIILQSFQQYQTYLKLAQIYHFCFKEGDIR
jgi:hypothetical protein